MIKINLRDKKVKEQFLRDIKEKFSQLFGEEKYAYIPEYFHLIKVLVTMYQVCY